MHVGTLVLGAGPTGLGAAWRLHELGETDWLMLDAAARPGGMASSERDPQGFVWDLGGHVIHSHFPYFDAVLKHVREWEYPRRGGWVWLSSGWVPTPIQQNLGLLAGGSRILDEISRSSRGSEADLHAWYVATFGTTLSELFFLPYNHKQWAHPPAMLDHGWTSLRAGSAAPNVPPPQLALGASAEPADRSRFPYPTHGTGSIWDAVAGRLPPRAQRYGVAVVGVELAERRIRLSDGMEVTFDQCISSIPLNRMLLLIGDRPDLGALAPELRHASIHALGFGFEGELPAVLRDKTWVMVPDPEVPFHRATILSSFSQAMAGAGRWSILCEVSVSAHRTVDVAQLVSGCLATLRQWGVTAEPISVWSRFLELGTPVPFLGRDALLSRILDELERFDLRSRGRFGGWRYESSNQDYAFMQGVEAVQASRVGDAEAVFWMDRPPREAPLPSPPLTLPLARP